MRRPSRARGFTLLELLVVVAIMAILFSLVSGGIRAARRSGNMAKEVNSARQLMGAYAAYASAHDGDLLPGYANFPAKDETGATIGAPMNSRWPWRLAPYFNYEMKILWGTSGSDDLMRMSGSSDRSGYLYRLSVEPVLGMNTIYVGGDFSAMDPTVPKTIQRFGQFCVTKMTQATHPAELIVFASAGGSYQKGGLTGYFKVQAPNFLSRNWPTLPAKDLSPEAYGNVDFRFDEKAVVAMLDGHVELLGFKELNDMRRWSNLAADLNDPDWKLGK